MVHELPAFCFYTSVGHIALGRPLALAPLALPLSELSELSDFSDLDLDLDLRSEK